MLYIIVDIFLLILIIGAYDLAIMEINYEMERLRNKQQIILRLLNKLRDKQNEK
jgi:hypothetical protein